MERTPGTRDSAPPMYKRFDGGNYIFKRFLTNNEKIIYRNLERSTLKLERSKSYLMFNETCYINDILPTYTNIKLYTIDSIPKCRWMYAKHKPKRMTRK